MSDAQAVINGVEVMNVEGDSRVPIALGRGGFVIDGYRMSDDGRVVRQPLAMDIERVLDLGIAPARMATLTQRDMARVSLAKVAPNLWVERGTRWVCARFGVVRVGGLEVPVAERLVVSEGGMFHLPTTGRPRAMSRAEACARFAESNCAPWPATPARLWPPPAPPIALMVSGEPTLDRYASEDFATLRRPAFVCASDATCVDTAALARLPVIASAKGYEHVAARVRGGVFDPTAEPDLRLVAARRAVVVFGEVDASWSRIMEVAR